MRRMQVRLNPIGQRCYPVTIGRQLGGTLMDFLRENQHRWSRLALVADSNVADLYAPELIGRLKQTGFEPLVLPFPAGEQAKSRQTKEELEDRLLDAGLGRDSLLLALGGGVTLDLAGFVAATFLRGIPYVSLPTTVLAMVDSSIGGKTAVDTKQGKNLIGAFHPPCAVFSDTRYLESLPSAVFRDGWAEAIKHGLIASSSHVDDLEAQARQILRRKSEVLEKMVADSVALKINFVEEDEREAGSRKALNFGHTFAHAMERLSGWRLSHGEAVARGLLAETRLSAHLAQLSPPEEARVGQLLGRFGFPHKPFAGLARELMPVPHGELTAETYLSATRWDKKARQGRVEYVLLNKIGHVARDGNRAEAWTWPLEDEIIRQVLFPSG